MSKIGKTPIEIVAGVSVVVNGNHVTVTGSKGNLSFVVPLGISARIEDTKVLIEQEEAKKSQTSALFGLTRAMIANMVEGVSKGFEKKLELAGVGYRASTSGSELQLSLGFSHPVKIKAPTGVTFAVAENVITVSGIDKNAVGNVAAEIRKIRPPEPYKGKGISYQGERIRRKAGKAAKAVGGK